MKPSFGVERGLLIVIAMNFDLSGITGRLCQPLMDFEIGRNCWKRCVGEGGGDSPTYAPVSPE